MQAIIKSLELMVMALSATAFAHFGVAPKQSPCPMDDHSARRTAIISASGAVASAAMQSVARRVP